MIVIEEC